MKSLIQSLAGFCELCAALTISLIIEPFTDQRTPDADTSLGLLFPPMLRRNGSGITLAELNEHYKAHVNPPKAEAVRLVVERNLKQ